MSTARATAAAVDIVLASGIPSATTAFDDGRRLGAALLAIGKWARIEVRVNDNMRSMVRYKMVSAQLAVSVHWRLIPYTDDLVEMVHQRSDPAWKRLAARLDAVLVPPSREPVLVAQGAVHDLQALMMAQLPHLSRPVTAPIGWGRWSARGPDRAIRLGSCSAGAHPVVKIHPVLDHADVPDWFVGFIVFHELLHIVVPPVEGETRRAVHSKAFLRAEWQHPDFHRAQAWEVLNVRSLLRRAREHADRKP